MLTKSRRKPTETITMLRPLATARRAPRRTRRWPWVAAAGGLLAVAAALAYAVFAWPRGGASLDPEALVRVHRPAFGTSGIRIRAQTERGRAVPVSLHRDGSVWPAVRVPAGERLSVEVVFRRPGWVSWLAGGEQRLHLELTAPVSHLTTRWLLVRRGQPVRLRFDRAVSELAGGGSSACGSSRIRARPSAWASSASPAPSPYARSPDDGSGFRRRTSSPGFRPGARPAC